MAKPVQLTQLAFKPMGKTAYLSVHTTPVAILVPVLSDIHIDEGVALRVTNTTGHLVFIGLGKTAAEAEANAVMPIDGAPTLAIPCCPNSSEIFGIDSNTYVAGYSQNSSVLYLTPGQGI